ncbi:hypothetical protein [Nocardiopsis kunsanensis]|uniref:hypothetical protein n=1 Tax=Nocardiopsis kunsanensis TaxID=141693 RepID=UPI00034551DB|nr:hypothetical protein [Nocardiopsis kunsanensis]
MTDQLVRQHIRAILRFEEEHDQRHEDLLKDYEVKGHRIVSGGQTGQDTWDVTDYRTGETIVEGDGGLEGYAKAVEEHGEMWLHIDPITMHLYDIPDPATPGLPESLCEALAMWVRDQASDEDIDQVLGG